MTDTYAIKQPMRIQARKGSPVEQRFYRASALPGMPWPTPKAIARGVSPAPLEDLIFHGGKIVAAMRFQNIYCGSSADWAASDISLIDSAISRAMSDKRLNAVMAQYFHRATLSCEAIESVILDDPKPDRLDEPDVQSKIGALFDSGKIKDADLDVTIFNLVLPRGAVLALGDANSRNGLGGYHGSVHIQRNGKDVTLYYSANVFSEGDNGIPAFDAAWKNVTATLYHELNEFRTDADVKDAIEKGSNDFLGWMSRQGHECGDEPIAAAASLAEVFQEVVVAGGMTNVPVQFMYSNVVHGPESP